MHRKIVIVKKAHIALSVECTNFLLIVDPLLQIVSTLSDNSAVKELKERRRYSIINVVCIRYQLNIFPFLNYSIPRSIYRFIVMCTCTLLFLKIMNYSRLYYCNLFKLFVFVHVILNKTRIKIKTHCKNKKIKNNEKNIHNKQYWGSESIGWEECHITILRIHFRTEFY